MILADVLHRLRRSSSLPTPHPVPYQIGLVGPVEVYAMVGSDVQPERRDAAASEADEYMIRCRPCRLRVKHIASADHYSAVDAHLLQHHIGQR